MPTPRVQQHGVHLGRWGVADRALEFGVLLHAATRSLLGRSRWGDHRQRELAEVRPGRALSLVAYRASASASVLESRQSRPIDNRAQQSLSRRLCNALTERGLRLVSSGLRC
eukprot:COSAG02_NODE_9247_length_2278_cov_8.100964_2_plen_112_part_00